jgi:hypothetical protein
MNGDEQALRQQLATKLPADAACPQCGFDRPTYRAAPSDFPGIEFHILLCHKCGLVVMWEVREASFGQNPTVVVIEIRGWDDPLQADQPGQRTLRQAGSDEPRGMGGRAYWHAGDLPHHVVEAQRPKQLPRLCL